MAVLSIIDRYISRLFLSYFASGLIVFVILFTVIDYMGNFVQIKVPMDLVLSYYLNYTPAIIYQMIPVACLLATVFTLSTLNKNNELVALFSSGMSLARISAAILVWVGIISVTSFFIGDRLLPSLAKKRNYLLYVEILNQPGRYSTIKTNRIWFRSKNILFNIKTLQADKGKAQGVTLYYFDDDWNLLQILAADQVTIKGNQWTLQNGTVTLFAKEQSSPLTEMFAHKTITMDEELGDLQSRTHIEDVLSMSELKQYIRKNKEAGLDTLHYEVQYNSKFSFAFAAFVMSFLGIPFSVSRQRSGGVFANIGICILLAFVYWAFYSSMTTMAEYGQAPPLVGAWLPNLTMLSASIAFLWRLKK